MKRSLIAAVLAFVGLAGCAQNGIDSQSAPDGTQWELLVLLLAGIVLYFAFSGLVTRLSRRAPRPGDSFDLASRRVVSRPRRAHHRRHREPPTSRPGRVVGGRRVESFLIEMWA